MSPTHRSSLGVRSPDKAPAWIGVIALVLVGCVTAFVMMSCRNDKVTAPQLRPLDPALVAQGKTVFRLDTYRNETFWTDTLRLHEVIRSGVSPKTALSVGLK